MVVAQYVRALRERWYIVLALTLVGLLGAMLLSWLPSPLYEAQVQLFVSVSDPDGDNSQLNQGSDFSQQRVKSYVNLVTSPKIMTAVIDDLNLPYTADELAEKVKVTSPIDTVLLDISATDTSPAQARDIANAIAAEFPRLVAEVETPDGRSASPVKVSVTRDATLPTDPVSPRVSLNLALGLLFGLASGFGVATLRHIFDRTIRSKADAIAVADTAVLGEVPGDPKTKTQPLAGDEHATPRGEAFRQLRTNIRFLSIDKKLSSFVVTSALPGEGKTTIAANLAITLAQTGERVVLIDADLRRSSLGHLFNLPTGVGLTNVLLGDVRIKDALHQWRPDLPLYILATGPKPPNPSELLASNKLVSIVETLETSGATVIFDAPPLLPVTDAAIIARATGGALVVTRMGKTRVDQLAGAVDALRTVDANILGLIANHAKRMKKSSYYGYYATQPTARHSTPAAAPAQALPSNRTESRG